MLVSPGWSLLSSDLLPGPRALDPLDSPAPVTPAELPSLLNRSDELPFKSAATAEGNTLLNSGL